MPPRKRPFYKYLSPETAIIVAESQTVRYSSPATFNDPFEFQSGIHFDFNPNSIPSEFLRRLEELASSSALPAVDPTDPWGKLVLLVRSNYATQGIPMPLRAERGIEAFQVLIDVLRDTQRRYQEHWWTTLFPGIRVFCVSEVVNSPLMWAHYAKNHTGVVYEFWSLPEEDNALSVAQPVEYQETPPVFFSETEFVDDLLSIKPIDINLLSRRYAYCKSAHWRYEQEWRVWHPLSQTKDHDYVQVRQSEFKAAYFGCRMPSDARENLKLALRQNFPAVQLFQAHREPSSYELSFTAASQETPDN